MYSPRILGHFRVLAVSAIAALLSTGGALAAQSLPSDLQQQQAALLYVHCLSEAALAHDDGTRSAIAVAREILPLCNASLAREEQTFSVGLSPDDRLAYQLAVARAHPALALDAVNGERGSDSQDGAPIAVAGQTKL